MANYVIGVDFGTLSGRAVLVDAQSGQIAAESVLEYGHRRHEERQRPGESQTDRSEGHHRAVQEGVLIMF